MNAMDQGLLPHKICPEPAACGSNSNFHGVHASQLRRARRIERDLVDQFPTPVALRWSPTTSPLALPTEVLLHRRNDNQRGDLDCHVGDMVQSHGNLILDSLNCSYATASPTRLYPASSCSREHASDISGSRQQAGNRAGAGRPRWLECDIWLWVPGLRVRRNHDGKLSYASCLALKQLKLFERELVATLPASPSGWCEGVVLDSDACRLDIAQQECSHATTSTSQSNPPSSYSREAH
jgi:hypothetical protein